MVRVFAGLNSRRKLHSEATAKGVALDRPVILGMHGTARVSEAECRFNSLFVGALKNSQLPFLGVGESVLFGFTRWLSYSLGVVLKIFKSQGKAQVLVFGSRKPRCEVGTSF